MCGILGGNNSNWNYEKGILSMIHRGPDGQRVVKFNRFTLAFARLSIIDLTANGMQPMFSENEDICIVFNGEIYGYKNLREELEGYGYHFRTQTDTEVIINAYMHWQDRFIDYIDGMFAIAIYDRKSEKIKIYRDRLGIKPLYYFYNGKDFIFSSELKGIRESALNLVLDIDNTAVYDYLNYLYIPEPKTLYKNVFKLLPANCLTFDIKTSRITKIKEYWHLKICSSLGRKRKGGDIEEELRHLVHKSVKEQMIADVPVGTFLSGGVDSSVITYESYQVNPKVEAFSIGFQERKSDESGYARILANKYDIPLNTEICQLGDVNKNYKSLYEWYDEPYADTSAFPTYMVSKMAKKKITVALTGDGGDEVFGGYPRHKEMEDYFKSPKLNSRQITKLFETVNRNHKYNKIGNFFREDIALLADTYLYADKPDKVAFRKKFGIDREYDDYWHLRKYYEEDLPIMTRIQYLDLKTYLPGDILTKVDRTSMAVSLETRVPLLSKEIVEFSFGLSQEERCPKMELKGLFKKAYEDKITKKLAYREKQGFSIPARYIKGSMSPQEKILSDIWNI